MNQHQKFRYQPTLPNVAARTAIWVRCLARRYRRTLIAAGSLALVAALGASAAMSPASSAAAVAHRR